MNIQIISLVVIAVVFAIAYFLNLPTTYEEFEKRYKENSALFGLLFGGLAGMFYMLMSSPNFQQLYKEDQEKRQRNRFFSSIFVLLALTVHLLVFAKLM